MGHRRCGEDDAEHHDYTAMAQGCPAGTAVLVFSALTARPVSADLVTMIAMADTDKVIRLRLLRGIHDAGVRTLDPDVAW
jgi:hypothetical protein